MALLLALLAPALGGGASAEAQAVLLTGIGLVAAGLPARNVRTGFLIGAGLVLVASLDWLWPARLSVLEWRDRLRAAGFPLEWSCSPEPWMSLRSWLLLLGGLLWAGWCTGHAWRSRERRVVCEGFSIGIGVLAVVALMSHAWWHGFVPGWPAGTGLGPFANRNQTAALFAMGAFLTAVCGVERLRHSSPGGKFWVAVGWLCLLGMYMVALALNRSRSGPILFLGMTTAWLAMVTPRWKGKVETVAVGLAVALLMGTVFLLSGSGVIERLAGTRVMDFRLKIFNDTVWMIRACPWTGVGLGCFEAIFPLYRNASILQERVLHPESDWLWLTAEAGLPGLLAMAGLLVWMGAQALRVAWTGLARREDVGIQLALCVACAGMVAHGFIDVPGHRLGTLMPAALLLGLAMRGEDDGTGKSWVLRGVGLVVLALGGAALGIMSVRMPEPLVNGLELLKARAAADEVAGRIGDGEATLQVAMKWAPLDWQLYVERARLEGEHGRITAALGDFRRARFLEPNYAGLPFEEGIYWLNVQSGFSVEAWGEALRRTERGRRAELYQAMLTNAYASHPELHWALWSLAGSDFGMELIYFGWATPEEFKQQVGEMLHDDPGLNSVRGEQLRKLFGLWMSKGDAQGLVFLLERRPEWRRAGYRALASYEAARGDLADAVELMEQYLSPPQTPDGATMRHAEAASRFRHDELDIAAGMALYQEAIGAGRDTEALETLQLMSARPGCPAYVHYLAGQLCVKHGRMQDAWKELEQCPE